LAYEFQHFPEKISPNLSRRIEEGWNYSYERYETAMQRAVRARQRFTELMRDYDILLSPSARGEAPQGLKTTGDSVFNRSWTLLGTPSVTIPCGTGPSNLPIGIQVSGAYNTDSTTLLCAHWAWHQLN
jgi:Asp-tRNA(Asn)/Glu-tRNA(Gln) amidotransferase A subunit family amidase